MYEHLQRLFSERQQEIKKAKELRNGTDRRDAYSRVIRSVLRASDIVMINKSYYVFDGRSYRHTEKQEITGCIINILDEYGVGSSDCAGMRDIYMTELQKKERTFNCNLVSFSNCVYGIESGQCYDFSPDFVPAMSLPYEFDPMAKATKWKKFLGEVLPIKEERQVLQEFFGMCFIDRAVLSIEKMALMVGSGANGKSVVCDVIKSVLGGNERVSNLSPDQLQDPKQIICLMGKILNFAPDVRKGAAFDSSLKALASSQDVTGWKIYDGSKPVKCPPLAFALNEMPYFKDTTSAFFRRLLIFGFDYVVPKEKQNRRLATELYKEEACGIFLWIMEGRNRLLKRNGMFTNCPAMDKRLESLTRRIKTEQSPVLQYLESADLSVSPTYDGQMPTKVTATEIYEGLKGMVSKYNITKELRGYGVATSRGKDLSYQLYKINDE